MANERRLIDANEAKKIAREHLSNPYEIISTCAVLDRTPTVDAVEVPCRCKECKHWKHFAHLGCTDFAKVCMLANYMIGANGYCLYGERRENG